LFAFNPSASVLPLVVPLNASLGIDCKGTPMSVRFAGSSARNAPSAHSLGFFDCGSAPTFDVPPTTAIVLQLDEWGKPDVIQVHGMATSSATVDHASGELSISGAQGEAGTSASALVVLPQGSAPAITNVKINGKSVSKFNASTCTVYQLQCIHFGGEWEGTLFGKNPSVGSLDGFKGGRWEATFSVPAAVLQDLKARNASYPVVYDTDPLSTDDANVAWLAPGRLLIFAKYKPLLNDTFNATGAIDGKPLLVRKAYNTIVRSPGRFIGYWADITDFVTADASHALELVLPGEQPWRIATGALSAGNDIDVFVGTMDKAKERCAASTSCTGFTFERPQAIASCANVASQEVKIYLKSAASGNGDASWCTVSKPPFPVGIFFDNVEAVPSIQFSG